MSLSSCVSAQETSFVDSLACATPAACQDNNVTSYQNISGATCSGENACSGNTMDVMLVTDGCTGEKVCSSNYNMDDMTVHGGCTGGLSSERPYGTCSNNQKTLTVIDATHCSGESSCSNNSAGLQLMEYVSDCTGDFSCTDNTAFMTSLGNNSCTGRGSCSLNAPSTGADESTQTTFVVGTTCCQGEDACKGGYGSANIGLGGYGSAIIIGDGACNGISSCQRWKVGSAFETGFTVYEGSCSGANSCLNLTSADSLDGTVTIMSGACTGENSCVGLSAAFEVMVQEGACTEDNSCQNCDNSFFDTGVQDCSGVPVGGSTNTAGAATLAGQSWWTLMTVLAPFFFMLCAIVLQQ